MNRPQESAVSGRLHYLDALRAAIMSMGVILHAGFFYESWFPDTVSYLSGLFRMGVFFFLAGFFSMMVVERYLLPYLYWDRIIRLGIPCLIFLLVFNPLTNYIQYFSRFDYESVTDFIQIYLSRSPGQPDWVNWHLHIWFLLVMLAYCLSMPVFLALVQGGPLAGALARLTRGEHGTARITAAVALGVAVLVVAGRTFHYLTFQPLLQGTDLNFVVQALAYYPAYFLLGVMAYRVPRLFEALCRPPWAQVAVAAGLLLAYELAADWLLVHGGMAVHEAIRHFVHTLAGVYLLVVLIALFGRIARGHHRWVRFLSDASYTVYLFHMFLLVAVHPLWMALELPPLTAYVANILAVYALCLLVHRYAVDVFAATRLLFNGKVERRVLFRLTGRQREAASPT